MKLRGLQTGAFLVGMLHWSPAYGHHDSQVNPNLPVGGAASDLQLGVSGLPEDVTQLAFVAQYGHYTRTFEGDEEVVGSGEPRLQSLMGTFLVRHHFGEGWSGELAVPLGLVKLSTHGTDADAVQQDMVTRRAGARHEASHIAGFGDVSLGGRYDFAALWGVGAYRPSLTFGLWLGLPTAEQATVSPEPTVPPTLLALGPGTWALTPSLTFAQRVHPSVTITVPVTLRLPLSRAETGRSPGTAFDVRTVLSYWPVELLSLRAGLGYGAVGYADEDVEGTILSSGGSWIRAIGGASLRLGERAVLGAGIRVPFYAHVHGRQISETFTVDATIGVVFGDDDEG